MVALTFCVHLGPYQLLVLILFCRNAFNFCCKSQVWSGFDYKRLFYHKLFPKIDKLEDHKRYFLKLKYINKGIDLIDISSIFRNPSVQKLISPENFDNTEPPIVSYIYKKPSRSFIFNYTTVSTDLNIEQNAPLSWNCSNSKFRYRPSGHVITGDLNFVQDRELKRFLLKGPKYRPPSKIDWNECRKVIYGALLAYCKKWIKREAADKKISTNAWR